MGERIEAFDAWSAGDAELRAVHALERLVRMESRPGQPPEPFEYWLLTARHRPSFRRDRAWVAWDGAEAVASAVTSWEDLASNRSHLDAHIAVHPLARRRGLGTALLDRVLDDAADLACDTLDGAILLHAGGAGFAAAAGGDRRLVERISGCVPAEIDRALLESWVRRAPERASGYSLVTWDGPVPGEHLHDFVELMHVMNTAPLGDLDLEPDAFTPAQARQFEESAAHSWDTWWTVCARHEPTGRLAGYTTINFLRHWPEIAWQGDTGVWPEHRERGLGRWLKAVNGLRLIEERPEVRWLYTGNAASNRAMLAINDAMGFRPVRYIGAWQVSVDAARRFVASRP